MVREIHAAETPAQKPIALPVKAGAKTIPGSPGHVGILTRTALQQSDDNDAVIAIPTGKPGYQGAVLAVGHLPVDRVSGAQGSSSGKKETTSDPLLLSVDVIDLPSISPLKIRIPDSNDVAVARQSVLPGMKSPEILQPEAAVTVVIQTSDLASVPLPAQTVGPEIQLTPVAHDQPSRIALNDVASVVDKTVPADAVAPAALAISTAELAKPASGGFPVPGTSAERKKGSAWPQDLSFAVTAQPKAETSAAISNQDVPVKTGDPTSMGDTVHRADSHQSLSPLQEPVLPEQRTAQPLRSVSLEFTPDGARDVRVRLSERSGEVHVSLHSSDPAITKGLRDGVTDLAGVLAHAGIDAEAWSGGRQHRENPRQEQEPFMQRNSHAGGAESFDGILQQPVPQQTIQEIS